MSRRLFEIVQGALREGGGPVATAKMTLNVLRREGWAGVRFRISHVRNNQKLAALRPSIPIMDSEAAAALADVRFDLPSDPEISIVVPVYNHLNHTIQCLQCLTSADTNYPFEVIVVDDGSSDPTEALVGQIPGLTFLKNAENLGFIGACNAGAQLARGRYLCFLNNDTQPDRDWLLHLRSTFDTHDRVGIVGSKLVYPTGLLQEAGGIVQYDGSTARLGRLADPQHPKYNYVCDVDYVSGASMMIKRSLFDELGCFDKRYLHSYYEDVDLCMAARQQGLRVLYQPRAHVVHHEGGSLTGENSKLTQRKRNETNRVIFSQKWAHLLNDIKPRENSANVFADCMTDGNALIVALQTPSFEVGDDRVFACIRELIQQGRRLHFLPLRDMSHAGAPTHTLQAMGVECIYAPYYASATTFLRERGDVFGEVYVSAQAESHTLLSNLKKHCPSARTQIMDLTIPTLQNASSPCF